MLAARRDNNYESQRIASRKSTKDPQLVLQRWCFGSIQRYYPVLSIPILCRQARRRAVWRGTLIIACTCGAAVNNTRMLGLDKGRTNNGDYNLILLLLCLLGGAVGIAYLFWLDMATPLTVLLYALLIVITTVRYYADVEFRIKTDFFRYMLFYLLISVGYIVGVFLFKLTDQWMLAMILGELAAVVYVCIRGHIFRPPFFQKSAQFRPIFSLFLCYLKTSLSTLTAFCC